MFKIKRSDPLRVALATQPKDKADGIICWVDQSWLVFGSKSKVPRDSRPVVTVRRGGWGFVAVLPCTSQNSRGNSDFFELCGDRVIWFRRPRRPSFAFYRFERIPEQALERRSGILSQKGRCELWEWLRERW